MLQNASTWTNYTFPDKDIELFLTDKFQDIKSSHRLRAYIPPQWPLPNALEQLVRKSSEQFIYASTIISYVASTRHRLVDRLDIILGVRPPQRDLPFAELDALYTSILADIEDIERVLEILSVVFFCDTFSLSPDWNRNPPIIENFLCLQSGDVELYLGELNSVVIIEPDQLARHSHPPCPFRWLLWRSYPFENILDQPPSSTHSPCSLVSRD